jgi:hypothetical protein
MEQKSHDIIAEVTDSVMCQYSDPIVIIIFGKEPGVEDSQEMEDEMPLETDNWFSEAFWDSIMGGGPTEVAGGGGGGGSSDSQYESHIPFAANMAPQGF